jgi:hypothetical protein
MRRQGELVGLKRSSGYEPERSASESEEPWALRPRIEGPTVNGPRPHTRQRDPQPRVYPYLRQEVGVERPNQSVGDRYHLPTG